MKNVRKSNTFWRHGWRYVCLANNCDLFEAYFGRCIKCSQNFCDVFRKSFWVCPFLFSLHFYFTNSSYASFQKFFITDHYILWAILKTAHPIKVNAWYIVWALTKIFIFQFKWDLSPLKHIISYFTTPLSNRIGLISKHEFLFILVSWGYTGLFVIVAPTCNILVPLSNTCPILQ